jgi:hypothetical protein
MNGLRWTLGIVTGLVTLAWLAFAVVGESFRRSFGASAKTTTTVVPVIGGALVVASLMWPERRLLLHAVAALMVVVAAGSLYLYRETAFVATLGLAYSAAWLFLYYRLVRA